MQPLVECSNKLEAFAYIDIDIVHEPRVTREASKGVDALMQNFEVGCPVELLNEFLGVTFYEEAKQVLQAMVTREEIKASLFAKEFTYY
ncbi:hypothetical protein V6N11_009368 [Hibiscus sabdariffa]|uniref:Uncharacterized protein n=1 Tax=Hibiscus sabdariffa TaxID=183260 RepID=A0ABR2NT49_9ROSI